MLLGNARVTDLLLQCLPGRLFAPERGVLLATDSCKSNSELIQGSPQMDSNLFQSYRRLIICDLCMDNNSMDNIRVRILLFVCVFACIATCAAAIDAPSHLRTDLIEHTDRVFLDGYPTDVSLDRLGEVIERYQVAAIRNRKPFFGWVVNDSSPNSVQQAYQILVATSRDLLLRNEGDIWNSGRVNSDNSSAVRFEGSSLKPATVYYWKVKVWNNRGEESQYSAIKGFITAEEFDGVTPRYPIQKQDEYPGLVKKINPNLFFVDFKKAAFGRLKLNLFSMTGEDTVTIHLGERVDGSRIAREMGRSSIRYSVYKLPLMAGTHSYIVKIRPDGKNTRGKNAASGVRPALMPEYAGEVLPFRYVEIENYVHDIDKADLVRQSAYYPFNEERASFSSSDTVLNQIWDISKYSVKATSFAGIYVDGDRERIPYENEAFTNLLSHYAVDSEYSIGRYTHEHLIMNPTWPTEWYLKSVQMAWHDYIYTGNPLSIERYYDDLKAKTLMDLEDPNGLISSRKGKQTEEFYRKIHFIGYKDGKALRDIVDWPHPGILGLKENQFGETDGYVFTDFNTVVNAHYYDALAKMSKIAEAVGAQDDVSFFASKAEGVKKRINTLLLNKRREYYVDGIGTDHSSLHANIYPLSYGIVPNQYTKSVLSFIKSRGMAANLSAPTLVDAVYEAGAADYGLDLLTSTDIRSWYNAIRLGSTMTIEVWDDKYKPNLDWNHAEGASPVFLISRNLMGIQPVEPAFKTIRIKPQPSTLKQASIVCPTIRGNIAVAFENDPGESFVLDVSIPANTVAEVHLPIISKRQRVSLNGKGVKGVEVNGFFVVENIGSGEMRFEVRK